jgi:deazaflavin-dependent oxidoreductase (nitroreductase family)
VANDWNQTVIDEFRANGGKVGGNFASVDLLLLTTTGAKSGESRVTPLAYRHVGDDLAVFASYAGNPKHPAWFHNLQANAAVVVEVGADTFAARARVTDGAERDLVWKAQIADVPAFGDYEAKTEGREIPVVVLERT